ncbi:uncharacterized protein EV154DRAFT_502962 [Mucor mucedo]|uniref:uncharacterized protein n=1 Tax=Mucor mucedo TaxID=29922 RepID=UPI00221F6031|nr:uncharacterized protein EV154DRAFT_502962 [Mucor mucedo]KAI7893000.1 hypothetical protein EV154DRAFT_502962 [Mucor mucedo]
MEDSFDFSDCPYCISFYIDEEFVFIDGFNSGCTTGKQIELYKGKFCRASLLYDATTGQILGEEDTAYNQRPWEENDTITYVENIFMELNNIYLKRKLLSYQKNLHDSIILHATVMFLRRAGSRFRTRFGIMSQWISSYHYVFNMPTHWDPTIKDEIIWPLFVEAELVKEDDHRSRILFHNQVDIKLKVATSYHNGLRNSSYVMYGLKFLGNNLIITMDLFSVHHCSVVILKDKSPIRLIESIYFTVPLKYETSNGIEACLEARGIIADSNLIQQLNELVEEFSTLQCFVRVPEEYTYKPFSAIEAENLGLLEDQVISIQSITMQEVLIEVLDDIKLAIMEKMNIFSNYGHVLCWETIIALHHTLQSEELCWTHFILFHSLSQWLIDYGMQQFNHVPLVVNKTPNCFVTLETNTLLDCNNSQTNEVVESFINQQDPLILSDLAEPNTSDIFSTSHLDGKPSYVINIDVSSERTGFICSILGDQNRVIGFTDYLICEIPSLTQYFVQPEIYQRGLLRIPTRIKSLVDVYFGDAIKNYSTEQDFYLEVRPGIKKLLTECPFDKFFFRNEDDFSVVDTNFLTLSRPGYRLCFVYIYLAYVNKMISVLMDTDFGDNWKEKNVGYLLYIDSKAKEVCLRRDRFEYILKGSCILNEEDTKQKGIILGDIGDVFARIQASLGSSTPVKSHFAVIYICQTDIFITVYQVFKIPSEIADASTSKTRCDHISVEDTNKVLCKNIWHRIKSRQTVKFCALHQNNKGADLGSLRTFKTVIKNISHHVSEIFSNSGKCLNMDKEISVSINNTCNCYFHLTLRMIIDFGMKPVIRNITDRLKGFLITSLSSYDMANILITGNAFKLTCNTALFTVYIALVRRAFYGNRWSIVSVLNQDPQELSDPIIDQKLDMCEIFATGMMSKVFKYTYALCIKSVVKDKQLYSGNSSGAYITTKEHSTVYGDDLNMAFVVTKRGDNISYKLNDVQFCIAFKHTNDYIPTSSYKATLGLVRILSIENFDLHSFIAIDAMLLHEVGSFDIDCEKKMYTSFELKVQSMYINGSQIIEFELCLPDIEHAERNNDIGDQVIDICEQLTVGYI